MPEEFLVTTLPKPLLEVESSEINIAYPAKSSGFI